MRVRVSISVSVTVRIRVRVKVRVRVMIIRMTHKQLNIPFCAHTALPVSEG